MGKWQSLTNLPYFVVAFTVLPGCALGSATNRKHSMSWRAWLVSRHYQDGGYSVSLPAWLYFRTIEAEKANRLVVLSVLRITYWERVKGKCLVLVLFAPLPLNIDFQDSLGSQFLCKIGKMSLALRIWRISIQETRVQKYKVKQNHVYKQTQEQKESARVLSPSFSKLTGIVTVVRTMTPKPQEVTWLLYSHRIPVQLGLTSWFLCSWLELFVLYYVVLFPYFLFNSLSWHWMSSASSLPLKEIYWGLKPEVVKDSSAQLQSYGGLGEGADSQVTVWSGALCLVHLLPSRCYFHST